MSIIEKAALERAEAKLREIARELRPISPSAALKADALARDLEIKREGPR